MSLADYFLFLFPAVHIFYKSTFHIILSSNFKTTQLNLRHTLYNGFQLPSCAGYVNKICGTNRILTLLCRVDLCYFSVQVKSSFLKLHRDFSHAQSKDTFSEYPAEFTSFLNPRMENAQLVVRF